MLLTSEIDNGKGTACPGTENCSWNLACMSLLHLKTEEAMTPRTGCIAAGTSHTTLGKTSL